MYVDISCFVVVERIAGLKGGVWDSTYNFLEFETNCPTVVAYVKRF